MDNNSAYPVGFYFSLSFEGEDAAFKEVSGISKELGIEEVAGGGENRFKYRLPTTSSSKNLILKRAIVPTGSSLIQWFSDTLDGGLATAIKTQDVSVNLLDNEAKVLKKWTFHNAYPVSYAVSDLKSQESEILIETMELAYTYFDVGTSS
ncbi:T4-like virus tail tube protein gp19 [Kordia sp. SMS9]|uniref:phage tail protein n=1 Tax=Kordia sp. SMS9 TaxID=2282170 RepID=UPI000E0D659E|nr:phage tail protein [Kordia sp. SMS9]AXG69263.1 T4-like virus tail tube protein gp19 [Kordia sp. SMS9]